MIASCTSEETGLGEIEVTEINESLSIVSGNKKKKPQSKYTDDDRYIIANFAKQHGPTKTANHFKQQYPTIRESTVRGFVKRLNENAKSAQRSGEPLEKKIKLQVQGRPCKLETTIDANSYPARFSAEKFPGNEVAINEKVRNFLIFIY